MGKLYIIATPIGNLQDITFRAIKTLFEVDVIACEDTRRAGILLANLAAPYNTLRARNGNENHHKPKLLSYYEQNELRRIPEILSMLQRGMDIALISDAGTPAISDPGFKLIRECIRSDIKVEALPGPSSVINALILSGLPTDKFTFVGYPPRKTSHRIIFYQNIKDAQQYISSTIIIFEAPHKILTSLSEMSEVFGDIDLVICRELTKIHEEVVREKISDAIEYFKSKGPKGEFVILFNLNKK